MLLNVAASCSRLPIHQCTHSSRTFMKSAIRSLATAKVNPDWDKAVNEAEKIVGYSTSFANLRWLMSDEVANVALHLRKLVGTEHPILKTAKNILYDGKNNIQAWGLLILLMSKAAGLKTNNTQTLYANDSEVFQRQRNLAEITEMIRNGHLIHKGLINIAVDNNSENRSDMFFGNKIALLTGDYLLVTANSMLSNLRNQHLSELISCALRDLSDAEFVGERNPQNMPLPSRPADDKTDITLAIDDDAKIQYLIGSGKRFEPLDTSDCIGNPVREWTMRNILSGGSLLGKGCEGALHLANHDQDLQDIGYVFGCHIALAWQAATDYNSLNNQRSEPFSLVSAPVLFALKDDPLLYNAIEPALQDVDLVNYDALRAATKKGTAMEQTNDLYLKHSTAAIKLLNSFTDENSVKALKDIILAIHCY